MVEHNTKLFILPGHRPGRINDPNDLKFSGSLVIVDFTRCDHSSFDLKNLRCEVVKEDPGLKKVLHIRLASEAAHQGHAW